MNVVFGMKKNEKKKSVAAPSGHGLARALSSAYQRLPEFPYLDRATTLILIVCIVGYLGAVAYIYFSTPPVEIQAKLSEQSLLKNSVLGIAAGEEYAYDISNPEENVRVQYAVREASSCKGVLVIEQSGQAISELCILKNGMLANVAEGEQANSNFGNQSILLFSPWMLAASENFSWQVDTVYYANGIEMSVPTYFMSKGKQQMAGREAYEIDVGDQSGSAPTRFFVDAEKRVLLYADMGNITVKISSAPFALNWTAGN